MRVSASTKLSRGHQLVTHPRLILSSRNLMLIFSLVKVKCMNATSFSLVINVRSLIAMFEYDKQRDLLLRDQIVIDVADNKKLLFNPQLTLEKAVEIVRAYETSSAKAEKMATESVNRLTMEKSKPEKPSAHTMPDQNHARRCSA
ncbi:hypothetical protein OUZ56_009691 [Daphnia magna]|uniref:Uncharacterized protein n=1 Tax=Daphnia magna TaxID=35525 RepID=A0ABR0AGX1_9CRUS|nr:hypothetical protein OUZ56_009691 [Daphnia magna]